MHTTLFHAARLARRTAMASLLGLGLTGAALAAGQSCLIEGDTLRADGKSRPEKFCMEAPASLSQADFKESCAELAQLYAASASGKPGKLTYQAQCPRPASGTCKGAFGGPVNTYYYDLSPAEAQEKRKACEASSPELKGGTWTGRP